ncbi:MAG: hypothetical protein LBE36_04340, partial [Flavobacteriaceae bacterium]|nr:hypothetical protein [Flavobacteriaceae bacterium]
MRKFLTYFLLATYLLSYTEAKQALKIPNFIEHYFSYQQRYQNAGFLSYIKMHYLEDQGKDADYEEDMQLPYKTVDFSIVFVGLQIPPKVYEYSFEQKKEFKEEKTRNFQYSDHFTTQHL